MPGKFVFPGGADRDARPRHAGGERTASRTPRRSYWKRVKEPGVRTWRAVWPSPRYANCARRPALLLGVTRDVPPSAPGDIWAEFAKACVHPDLANIHFIARAIAAAAPANRMPFRHPLLHRRRFLDRAQNRRRDRAGPPNWSNWCGSRLPKQPSLDMPTITGVVLEELAARVGGRDGAQPAGAVLLHGRSAVLSRIAFNKLGANAGFLDILARGR